MIRTRPFLAYTPARATRCIAIGIGALSMALSSASIHAENWVVTPNLTIRGTYSDNIGLAPKGRERSDFVAELVPGVRITTNHPRLKLNADYQHQEFYYLDDSSRGRSVDLLRADATWEAIEQLFFVDAQANVSEQAISLFGAQAPSGANVTDNRTELRSFRVSPYIRGAIGNRTNYELRYVLTDTSSDAAAISRARTEEQRASINTAVTSTVGLGFSYDHSNSMLRGNSREPERDRTIERYLVTLSYAPEEHFRVFGSLGQEKSNFFGDGKFRRTEGYGFSWSPTPRTSLNAQRDRRFFGVGHSFEIAHRMPSSAISVAWVRDVSSLADLVLEPVGGNLRTVLSDALTRRFPEPAQRNLAVQSLLNVLGLTGNELLLLPTLSDRIFTSRSLTATYAVSGGVNTLTLIVARSDRRAISTGESVLDDFAGDRDVRTQTFGINWSHTLSSVTTLTAAVTQLRSTGLGEAAESSRTTSATVGSYHRLSPRTSASLDLRHVLFRGSVRDDYRENAIVASLFYAF